MDIFHLEFDVKKINDVCTNVLKQRRLSWMVGMLAHVKEVQLEA